MVAEWTNIVITAPDYIPTAGSMPDHCLEAIKHEASSITEILASGAADIVHIRKPEWDRAEVERLLQAIPCRLHPQLRLHDHFCLLDSYPEIGGVHINSRNPVPPRNAKCVSASCHSIDELEKMASCYDYVTLSPVFDSISKSGYSGRFADRAVSEHLRGKNVIALGGVTAAHFFYLKDMGFRGAAMLGYIWSGLPDTDRYSANMHAAANAKAMLCNFSLQFVTDGSDVEQTVEQVRDAIEGGCRWIQIRMKGKSMDEHARAVEAVKPLCVEKGCVLLIDDNISIAARYGIGVHLGKNDMPTEQAKEILPADAILGRTANNEEDIMTLEDSPRVDYIGLGPFRFTRTKQKLAPVLGLEGYASLMRGVMHRGHRMPVVAIGGITPDDVAPLLHAGVDGIAVSGAIAHASDRVEATRRFVNEINKYYNKKIL